VQARWLALPAEQRGPAWSAIERAWQWALALAWGGDFRVCEQGELLLTTDLPEAEARRLLDFAGGALGIIERCLAGLGVREFIDRPEGYNGAGLDVMVVCRRVEDYLDYVSDADEPEHAGAISGGVCLREGASHVAAHGENSGELEPVLAHELAHSRLIQWQLPVWLEEGLVTHLETAVQPHDGFALDLHTAALHRQFWTPGRLRRFFDGRAFCGAEDAEGLPYHLAHWVFGELMQAGGDQLLALLDLATWEDDGASACAAVYGGRLEDLLPDFIREAAAANAQAGAPDQEQAGDDDGDGADWFDGDDDDGPL
jgi:hypothetical protein